jgi:hypothetical protein
MVSKFVQAESLVKKLTCSADIVEAIIKRQNMANENNKGFFSNLFAHIKLNFLSFFFY